MRPQDYALFYAGAKGEMRSKKLPIGEGELPDELLVAVSDFEANTGKTIEQYETAAEGITAFRDHLAAYEPPTMYETLSATLTVHTGVGSLSITIKPISGHMEAAINAALRDLEAFGLTAPRVQQPGAAESYSRTAQTPAPTTDGTVEEWPVVGFSKKLDPKSNEIRYRVHGGRWQEWGVAVYSEALKQYPFIAETAGDNKIVAPHFPMTAKVSLKPDGKPKRLEGLRW